MAQFEARALSCGWERGAAPRRRRHDAKETAINLCIKTSENFGTWPLYTCAGKLTIKSAFPRVRVQGSAGIQKYFEHTQS